MKSEEEIIKKIRNYCQEIIDTYDNGNYCFEDSDYYRGRAGVAEDILEIISE